MRAALSVTASVLLACGLCLQASASASPRDRLAKNKPALKITASVDASAPEGQPILVVHLLNLSSQELRLPDPPLLCEPAPGALSLETRFSPASGGKARHPADCGLVVDSSSLPDIRERAKDWITIPPGQDHTVRRPLSMGVDASTAGTYHFRVVYNGPSANESDTEKLKAARIEAPEGQFTSPRFTYKVRAPK